MATPLRNAGANDGFGAVSSRTSTLNWGSAKSAQFYLASIMIVSATNTPAAVSTITDAEGNAWTRLDAITVAGATTNLASGIAKAGTLEVWYAPAPNSGASGTNPTITFSTTIDAVTVSYDRFDNVSTTRPFDRDPSLPAAVQRVNSSSTSSSTVSTTTNNTEIIQTIGGIGSGEGSFNGTIGGAAFSDFSNDGTTFTQVNQANVRTGGKTFTSPQSSVASVASSAQDNSLMLTFALTADSQPALGNTKRNYRVQIG